MILYKHGNSYVHALAPEATAPGAKHWFNLGGGCLLSVYRGNISKYILEYFILN